MCGIVAYLGHRHALPVIIKGLKRLERKGHVFESETDSEVLIHFIDEIHRTHQCPLEEAVSPLVAVVPLQLLAYHIAVMRGCDVDQPRNLAKSVTVE